MGELDHCMIPKGDHAVKLGPLCRPPLLGSNPRFFPIQVGFSYPKAEWVTHSYVGDELLVVNGEQRAKEVLEFRKEVRIEAERKSSQVTSVEELPPYVFFHHVHAFLTVHSETKQ